jgi:hypothetical protein
MSFSPNLTYFVERLQGVSVNTFKLETQNRTTAGSGDIIAFDLPSNAIVNLRSLKVWCTASANAGTVCGARLPPINDLVERVEVSVGGQILAQGANFVNVLGEAQKALQYGDCDSITGHPEYVREKSYVNGLGAGAAILSGVLNEDYPTTGPAKFCIDKFPGFLDSAEPKLLDTSLMPDIRVRLYMASDNVLTTSLGVGMGTAVAAAPFSAGFARTGSVGAAKYLLSNLRASVEVIGLADQTYDQMISAQMSQQGFLEIPYKGYTSFQETHSGSSRFTISTQSLDKVIVTWRATNYNTAQAAPLIVNGYKTGGGFIMGAIATGANATQDLGLPQYDVGGVLGTNSEKYKSKYFNFIAPDETMKMQLQLNGSSMPNFTADLGELHGITRNSLQGARSSKDISFDQYINNYCVQVFRLNMPDSDYSRVISGLDTRAVNLQGIVRTENTTGSANLAINIFCESTETLRVGPGRSIEILA